VEQDMSEDPRCCGSGTCIIDAEGRCWCGQQWNGQKMAAPPLQPGGDARGQGQGAVDPDAAAHP
jgi:hypothetical protein